MKTTNHLIKTAIVISVVTIFSACNKEVNQPLNNLNASNSSAAAQVNPSAITKTRTGTTTGYFFGMGEDSTRANP